MAIPEDYIGKLDTQRHRSKKRACCRDAPVISSKMIAFSLLKIRVNRRYFFGFCHFAHCYSLVKNHRTMPIVAVYLEKDVFIPQSIIGNTAFSSLITFR